MSCLRRLGSVVLLLSPLVLFVNSTSAAAFKRVHEGEEAPGFALPGLDGNAVDLKAYHDGPLTVLVFWASWNEKSEPLLQDVQKILDEFGGRGVKALGINAEGQNPPADLDARIQDFAKKGGLRFPMVVDRKLEQYEAWGVIALSATAFLGKDMKVVFEFSGHPTSAYQDMREHAMEVLGIKEQVAEAQKPKRERYKPAAKTATLNYGLARTLFERGQFDQAAAKVEKVLAEDPKFPDAHALSGAIQLGLERNGKAEAGPKAREAFAKAVELDGHVPLGLAGAAHFALKDGDVPKALELARRALEFSEPHDAKPKEHPKHEGATKEGIMDEAAPKERERPQMKEGVKLREAASEVPGAAPKEAPAEAAPPPPAPVDVAAVLAEAEKALGAGDSKTAGAETEKAVSALLAIPQGPKLKKTGLVEKVLKPAPQ